MPLQGEAGRQEFFQGRPKGGGRHAEFTARDEPGLALSEAIEQVDIHAVGRVAAYRSAPGILAGPDQSIRGPPSAPGEAAPHASA